MSLKTNVLPRQHQGGNPPPQNKKQQKKKTEPQKKNPQIKKTPKNINKQTNPGKHARKTEKKTVLRLSIHN